MWTPMTNFDPDQTLSDFLKDLTERLSAQTPEPRREALRLTEAALGLSALDVLVSHHQPLHAFKALNRLETWIQRRLRGEPLSRLIGQKDFWRHTFDISPATLDPRPETEMLIEQTIERFPDNKQILTFLPLSTMGCLYYLHSLCAMGSML